MLVTTATRRGARPYDEDFTSWVLARQDGLVRTAYLLCGDQGRAEDLVQTVLAKAYLSWGRITAAASPDAYVRRMIVNENTSWWRRAWRTREVSVPEVRDSTYDSGVDALAERQVMVDALRRLPERQRAVVVLRYYEDRSEAEVAELLGCSVGTVKSQCSRGLASMRGHLRSANANAATEDEGGAR